VTSPEPAPGHPLHGPVDLGDESVALRRNRLDQYPVAPIVTQGTSQHQNCARQGIFLNEAVVPNCLEQIALFHQVASFADQQQKNLQRLWFECDPFFLLIKAEIFLA
jgi:hypothetical protein